MFILKPGVQAYMERGKLFFAMMYKDKGIFEKAVEYLKDDFGAMLSSSAEYDFNFTDYYKEEFGTDLKKTLIVFDKIINDEDLAEIKIISSHVEDEFCSDGNKRAINIDPGYFNDKGVVLASFKGKDFKDCIEGDVFAHKVLGFDNGTIKDFFHTFPDFKSSIVKDFFIKLIK